MISELFRRVLAAGSPAVFLLCLQATQPASAQGAATFDGYWTPIMHEDQIERGQGPPAGNYTGIPLSEAGRVRADTWDASLLTVPEHQCKPHPAFYGFRAVGMMRMWHDREERSQDLISINTRQQWAGGPERKIWMDGREHPSDMTPHTWQGFSTGKWEGQQLVARTTHLKSSYIRRSGVVVSDRATLEDRFHRHGDVLVHVSIVTDPVYLTEPFIRTNNFRYTPNGTMTPYPCRYAIEVIRPQGVIPYTELGLRTASKEFAQAVGLPIEVIQGGAETLLPEFQKRIPPRSLQPAR
ncbi:MAG: hypothetical protein RLZZ403_1669 [Pseudomonadota bacterium]